MSDTATLHTDLREDEDVLGDPDDSEASESAQTWIPSGAIARARRELYATAYRLRRQLLPHAAAGSVAGVGLAAHSIVAAGGMPASGASLVLAAAAFPAAFGISRVTRRRRPRWARRALAAGVAGAAWLTIAPFGVGAEQAAALTVADCVIGAGWWQRNRLGYPDLTAEPVTDVPVTTLADAIEADWDEFIACDGGPLARSRLFNATVTDHTIAFDGEFWRGRQTLLTATSALPKLAGGVGRRVQDIIVESDPAAKSDARFRFQVVTNSPISGDVRFTGPRRHGGTLDLGPYADGSGEAPHRLYTPGSMWSGVIIGGTGIGKSRLVENIVISAISGGDTVYIYICPQGGVSSPALARHSHWFADRHDAQFVLDAILAALLARGEENAAEGWAGFTPSPERPGILVVVEECHEVFTPKTVPGWSKVAREGRKLGFALLAVDQYPGIKTFGNDEPLRSSVMEGNAHVLRSTSNQTGQLMAGLQVNPLTLPKIPGYAYTNGCEENGIRTAPYRNRDTGKDVEPTLAWLNAQPMPDLDPLVTTAITHSTAGAAYLGRKSSAEDRQAAARARVEAFRAGINPDEGNVRTGPAPAAMGDSDMGELIQFPGPLTLQDITGRPLDLSASHSAVLDAVAAGATRPSEVEAATGLKHRRVAELLSELVSAGYLTQPRYGRYQRAA